VNGVKLIYHGTVSQRFGLLKAVNALYKIKAHLPESVLYIYGKYDPIYKKEIEERILELDLSESIFLHERQRLEEIYRLVKKADIGVVPYRNDEFMNLALSTKTFEYIAAGIPVVASRMNSTMRLFDDNCITYFDPDSEDDFVEKILLLCEKPQLRRKRVYAAAAAFVPYSGEEMYKRLINLVKHLSNNHSL
jgi:glycosyltransferase involved in cell wall biosynthesis